MQLPPKRRQIISLMLTRSDIAAAKSIVNEVNFSAFEEIATEDRRLRVSNKHDGVFLHLLLRFGDHIFNICLCCIVHSMSLL